MIDVAVVGAAGYVGIEAVRWVLAHPGLFLTCATSGTDAGRPVSASYPALTGLTDVVFSEPDPEAIARKSKVALLAVPHTAAMGIVPGLLEAGLTVIDLSADFRLTDAGVYEQWYETPHTAAGLLAEAVYGLPELNRSKLAGARLVACPGCYPTATVLAALPALEGPAVDSHIVVDAKSGISGAGRTPSAKVHYCSASESVSAYGDCKHRHIPEIEQVLSLALYEEISVVFAPHLIPMARGLLATVYIRVEKGFTTAKAVGLYRGRYRDEPFVHVHSAGVMPSTSEVRMTNRAAIGVMVDERTDTLVATCAIDNLGKGAASQAIQCLNTVFGLPETEGLNAWSGVV